MDRQPRNESELHFHYNRDERLAQAERRPRFITKGSIFRRNRSLLIILLDILLLLIVFGVWWGFLRTPEDTLVRDGYRFELAALSTGEEILATLTITNRGDAVDASIFDAEFRTTHDENDREGAVLSDRDVLPVPGDVRTMRVRFSGSGDRIELTVRYGETELSLRTRVR